MDLTSEFCHDFQNELLANIDPNTINSVVKWYNYNEQRLQRSANKPFVLLGRLAGLNDGSKFGVQGDKVGVGGRAVSAVSTISSLAHVFEV